MSILTRLRWTDGAGSPIRFSLIRSPRFAQFVSALWLGMYSYLWGEQYFTSFGRTPGWSSAALWGIGCGLLAALLFSKRRPALRDLSNPSERLRSGLHHLGWGAWTVFLPFLGQYILDLVGLLTASQIDQPFVSGVIMLTSAVLWWSFPAFLVGREWGGLSGQNNARILAGYAAGLAGMAILIAPAIGAAIGTTCLILGSAAYFISSLVDEKHAEIRRSPRDSTRRIDAPPEISSATSPTTIFLILWGAVLGACFPLINRMICQWIPASSYLEAMMWSGVALGASLAYWLLHRSSRADARNWHRLVLIASCALPITLAGLLAGFDLGIDLNLWINARISQAWIVQLLRGLEAMLPMLAIGLTGTLGWYECRQRHCDEPSADVPPHDTRLSTIALFALGLGTACGLTAMNNWGMTAGSTSDAAVRLLILLCALLIWRHRPAVEIGSRRRAVAITATLGMCLLFAWSGRGAYNAVRSAKLLFSTTVFAAYNSEWDKSLLPYLDEGRCLDTREGTYGTQTVWSFQGVQYQFRENGVPRGVISVDPLISPDYTGEVLAAVIPLVLHDSPRRMLLLGLGGGTPLRTILDFPVADVVCDEPDASLIDLQRKVVAEKLGRQILDDDRVHLRSLEPVLSVTGRDAPYDVILSNPPQASLSHSTSSFTREFYQRVADRLTAEGLFCQRFQQADFGARPLSVISRTLRDVFVEVVVIETGPAEVLMIATKTPHQIVRAGLVERLQAPQVRRVLANIGWDWSILLNLNTVMNQQVDEMIAAGQLPANTVQNLTFATELPREVMRWGQKHEEIRQLTVDKAGHFLKEIDEQEQSPELLNRLSDVTARNRLMTEYPDQYWVYRKTVRQQVTSHPRTLIRPVSGGDEFAGLHPADRRRLDYFEALGRAASQKSPDIELLAHVASFAQPYDPLLSYFIHQEVAELYSRSELKGSSEECRHRLYAVYFGFSSDRSVRNVIEALQMIVESPQAIPDAQDRWDQLNALLQILKIRWDNRGQMTPESARIAMNDVEKSLVAVERTFDCMNGLRSEIGLSDEEWDARKTVVEKGLVRPLRTYRNKILPIHQREQRRINKMIKASNDAQEKQTSSSTDSSDSGESANPNVSPRLTPALDSLLVP
ncbi:MAG: hypothetical protein O3A29_17695 [Planctomycetota bacterium]|nr:hypothetical protein [Planctomycetota bacterium]